MRRRAMQLAEAVVEGEEIVKSAGVIWVCFPPALAPCTMLM